MKNKNMPRKKMQKGVLGRTLKALFKCYPKMMTVALICIVFNAVVSSLPSIFMERIFSIVTDTLKLGKGWEYCGDEIVRDMLLLIGLYVLALISGAVNKQFMAIITQGFLKKLRGQMFNGMQNLPIKYFDTNSHGDIMSYYTNDIDALRQMVSESLPNLLASAIMVLTLFFIMLWYSFWLTLIVLAGVIAIFFVTKTVGGGAGKYFLGQQRAMGKTEGFIEEMMNGQKVVKVFCHEEENKKEFKKLNDRLFVSADRANTFANFLGPINAQLGNISYVVCAIVGGMLALNHVGGFTLGGLASFLTFNKSFSMPINQVSQQLNAVVMAMAGAQRVFGLLDEKEEQDKGYVTLVNAAEVDGVLKESEERTGRWAWKHTHQADGSVDYVEVRGDVVFNGVDFGYNDDKIVLHDVKLFAEPGQKIAIVGPTGAGKTTMVKLLMRFYDVGGGSIKVDGHDVRDFNRSELREMFGMVLQDTWLFQGTVWENIAYGRENATREEVAAAAKAAHTAQEDGADGSAAQG